MSLERHEIPLSSLSARDRRALINARNIFLEHAEEAERYGNASDENLFSVDFVRGELPDDDVTGWAYQISQWGQDEADKVSARVDKIVRKHLRRSAKKSGR